MDRNDIREGIMLFQYSSTAQRSHRAPQLLRVLWNLYRNNEIGFHDLGRRSLHGTWLEGRRGHDLRINTAYMNHLPSTLRLGALSLLLVHEGTHATVDFAKLYDELAARILPIHYFRELSGPGVFNEASDPPRPGRSTEIVRLGPGSMPSFERQSAALMRNQLIDHVLSIKSYRHRNYINPQWIVDNLNHWGGLRNRTPETRGRFISVLTSSADVHVTRAILDIMESAATRADWDDMMKKAGSLRSIQITLDVLSARPEYAPRILALERRWNVHLREAAPLR